MYSFHKYHSLGNDFIIFDWRLFSEEALNQRLDTDDFRGFIRAICKRHFGVGADGVLIIRPHDCMMFNPDGSNGEKCLNGIRCLAHYLYQYQHYPENFTLTMSHDEIECAILSNGQDIRIKLIIKNSRYVKSLSIQLDEENELAGHVVDVGNPHFVILDDKGEGWLQQQGGRIECFKAFPKRTNVELVYERMERAGKRQFDVLVHERGCGMTLACGSGAAAIVRALRHLKKIGTDEAVDIVMQGGTLESFVNRDNEVVQIGRAVSVCSGRLEGALRHDITLCTERSN